MRDIALSFCWIIALTGCSKMAIMAAPDKVATASTDDATKAANKLFWDTLHAGNYDGIPSVLEALTAAYLKNPNDVDTTAHLGFTHIWRLSENVRQPAPSATITDAAVLSRKYFEEAVRLAPGDARFAGFLASMEMSEGSIHRDEKLIRRGYFDMLDAKKAYPEFNLFTFGYVMSRAPHTDKMYEEALEDQWKNIELCIGQKLDHKASFAKFMTLETTEGAKRVCWNSWIAPHNIEGFFLNLGDMLVKQGDVETARAQYANAKHSKSYDRWPFKQDLEARIAEAEANVARFRDPPAGEKTRTLMLHSQFSCTGCHQE